jgi:Nuclease-related domain/UvrD-like helicase C-terminal domain/AAA domain
MAIFPQGLSNVDARCRGGERRVLQQLKRCLEDDYLVWHDVPIGPKARQPDFVILNPRRGVLILEVKGWRAGTLARADRDSVTLRGDSGAVITANPLRQARDYMLELVHLMERDEALIRHDGPFAGKLLFPYGHGAVFSGIRRSELAGSDFAAVFPEHKTLLRDDLEDEVPAELFQNRLWGMFTLHFPYTLTLPQRDRIRWHLFPEIRLQQQSQLDFEDTSAAAPAQLPDLLQVMDLQQEQIARSLGEGHRVIHGAAGSGKTMILVFRAQHLLAAASPDRPVLVLCFNRTLAHRIEALLRQRGADERLQVRTFHSWCQDMIKSYQLTVPAQRDQDYYAAMAQAVQRAVETRLIPTGQYTALLIDEAHDFEDDWLRMAVQMVSPATQSLLVLYDDAQSIYQKQRRKFNFASVGIEARGRTNVLKLNYRNTAEVLALAVHCAHSLLTSDSATPLSDGDVPLVHPASAGRRGPAPVFIGAAAAQEEAALMAERIAELNDQRVPLSEIAVLARTKFLLAPIERALGTRGLAVQSMGMQAFKRFDWQRPSIKLLTMHSAKGLEFQHVFVIGLQALPMRDESIEDAIRLLYVAMTRATQALVLSAHGRSEIVSRVERSLAMTSGQLLG